MMFTTFRYCFLDPVCVEGKGRTLGFENTLPAFLILLVGVAVGVAALVIENIYRYRSCRIKADRASSSLSSHLDETKYISIYCHVCKKPINLEDSTKFVACYHPNGIAHFGSHLACLGIYPESAEDRASVKACYRCLQHCKK